MSHDDGVEYVALSYIWGNVDQCTINAETYSDRSNRRVRGLRSVQLPKTIADALQVVKFLGLRYLWMDSICICPIRSRFSRRRVWMHLAISSGVYRNFSFGIGESPLPITLCGLQYLSQRLPHSGM
jgi:hypothetical protein